MGSNRSGRQSFFVNSNKIEDLCNRCDGPGKYIKKIQGLYRSPKGKDRVNPDDTEYTGTKDNDDGRQKTSAKPPGSRDGTVHKGRHGIRKCHDRQTVDSGFHDGMVVGKKRKERIPEQVDSHTDDQPDQKGISQADHIAFYNPFFFPCAQVLCDKT